MTPTDPPIIEPDGPPPDPDAEGLLVAGDPDLAQPTQDPADVLELIELIADDIDAEVEP